MLRLSENVNKFEAVQTIIEPFCPNPNPWIVEENLIIISNQLILITVVILRQVRSRDRMTRSENESM